MFAVKSKIAEKLNIPEDIAEGLPIVTVTGKGEVYVENYKGIIEYILENTNITIHYITSDFNDNIFKILVNAAASEHGARMSSMDSATRNAKKMISELTLKYNSLQQSPP